MLYIDVTRLYNNQRLGKGATGVDKVSYAYIQAFQNRACCVIRLPKQWLFFKPTSSEKLFRRLLNNQSISLPKGVLKFLYTSPIRGEQNFYLNTSHSGLENVDFDKILALFNLKGIYFLHDLIPVDYPEFCRVGEESRHILRLKNMAKGELVISNSRYTHQRFLDFCHSQNLAMPNAIWAHLADENNVISQKTMPDIIMTHSYFLMVGTIEGRKNHLFLLNIWRLLQQRLGSNCPKLVIVGKRGWECEQVFAILNRSRELKQVVVEINHCDDAGLQQLMLGARALLFPSLVEGYGLPLIEAYRQKVPVIASNIEAFQEISKGICELLSPVDGEGWLNMIIEYNKKDSTLREAQIKKLYEVAEKLPTWEEHFSKVIPVINKIYNG